MDEKRRFWTRISILGAAAGILMAVSGLAVAQTPGPATEPTVHMLTAIAGFSGSAGNQPEAPASLPGNVVGPAGGRISSSTGRLVLEIPPGALTADTEIVISEREPDEGPTVGPVFDLKPDGLAFAVPARLLIHYYPDDVPEGYKLEDIAIMEVAPPDGAQMDSNVVSTFDESVVIPFLETTVDPQAGTASVTVEHFSSYGARAYSSYTLGNPEDNNLRGIFDFGGKGAATDGPGSAIVDYDLLGYIDMNVAVPIGARGAATAGAVLSKWFRVKAGSQGQTSVNNGVVGVSVVHNGRLADGSNDYRVIVSVQCADPQQKGAGIFMGTPDMVSAFAAGEFVATGQVAQRYYMDPWGMGIDPPYSPDTLDVTFSNCNLVAGNWYVITVGLSASVIGQPPDEYGNPPGGGNVSFSVDESYSPGGGFVVERSFVQG